MEGSAGMRAPGFRRHVRLAGIGVFCLLLAAHLALALLWVLAGGRPAAQVEPRGYRNVLGDLEPRLRLTDREIPGLPYQVSLNNQGLRGTRPVSAARKPGTLRVLCLGDSYTYGVGVDDALAYPAQLRSILAKRLPGLDVEVVNAGVPFYDLFDELAYYREKGARLAPDVVVLQFYINDLEAMAGSFFREDLLVRQGGDYNAFEQAIGREAAERRINAWLDVHFPWLVGLVRGGGLPQGPSRAETGPFAVYHIKPTDEEQALLRDRNRQLSTASDRQAKRFWDNYRRALLEFRDAVAASGAKLLFVIAPDAAQVREDYNQPAAALVPFCRENGIPVLDLARQLRVMSGEKVERYYLLPVNGHINAEGNTVWAAAVADSLRVSPKPGGFDVTVAPAFPAFGYEAPMRLNLRFDGGGIVPVDRGPLRVRVVRSANLLPWAVDTGHGGNRIAGLVPDVGRGPVGELVLRLDSDTPLDQVSVTLFRKLAPPINGYVLLGWSRHDGDYKTVLFGSDADVAAPESYETSRLAEIDLRGAPARELYLRLELRNEARVFAESADPPWRRFEIVGYPARENAPVSAAATDRPASPAGPGPRPD
ncbi:GDSL-type esterase/lipase family protein [Solidesulfovibrio sp.]|uniref:GDSL-type esterase/lipase family protein n=1 Tax=Solidesulfovibrio sp. TaxID=2910990 RepID=UPI002B21A049|nr:GDSL-type esterase/lipase family protein [Solidesulfovibrio sp.]MEA4855916.1 GDSL-type esterase/lipase family protein [Solidesulfovibrio sp.]